LNNIYTPSLLEKLRTYLPENHSDAHRILHHLQSLGRQFLLSTDLHDNLQQLCESEGGECLRGTPLADVIQITQEAALDASWIYLALRRRIGRWLYLRIHLETMDAAEISVSEFLRFKEHLVNGSQGTDEWLLEVDLKPFSREFQKPREARSTFFPGVSKTSRGPFHWSWRRVSQPPSLQPTV